jgi:peptide/nickel transport system substrate-binding protein
MYAAESMGETLEPGLFNGFGSINVVDNVCECLTSPDPDKWTAPAQPGLAESWELSDDGKTYTFKIREGVEFHDGAPVNADAVVRSLTRQTNPDDPSYAEGLYMYTQTGYNNWESITAEDEYVVKIVLKTPDATQLHRLFHPAAAILSPKALDEYGPDIGNNLVGAGPFKLTRFTAGQEAVLERYENYWRGDDKPYLERVVMRGYPDLGGMLAAVESGEVQLAPYPPASAVDRFKGSGDLDVQVGPPLITLFLACCTLNAPLDNPDVRKAINYAVNRENIIEGVLYGLATSPATLIGPEELGFAEDLRERSQQDIEKAKEHIEASGLETPIELEFSFENTRFWPRIAELVKSDLEAVGFSVSLDRLDSGSYWGKVLGGEAQLSMNQRSLWVPDPNNKVEILLSSEVTAQQETGVASQPYSEDIDRLINAGRTELDPEKRAEIYRELQELILEHLPYVTLGYYTKPVVMTKNMRDLPVAGASTERVFLRDVWLERA